VAEYLMQCVCSEQLNVQLKAVLTVKHLAAEDVTFQQYMQSCPGALKILEDIAAPPIVPQARSLETQEVRTVRDATTAAIMAIHTPHTIEKSTEQANLKQKIHGFGNFEPPPDEDASKANGVVDQVAEFVGDSVGDMVDDFKEKGAVGALKDATIDALDLVLDGVDAVWGWVAGKSDDQAPRICQPVAGGAGTLPMPPPTSALRPVGNVPQSAFQPPPVNQFSSASNHYAAAFGGAVVGANNPVVLTTPTTQMPSPVPPSPAHVVATDSAAPSTVPLATPAAQVDLLSMDEPARDAKAANPSDGTVPDLLGDICDAAGSQPVAQKAPDLLDFSDSTNGGCLSKTPNAPTTPGGYSKGACGDNSLIDLANAGSANFQLGVAVSTKATPTAGPPVHATQDMLDL